MKGIVPIFIVVSVLAVSTTNAVQFDVTKINGNIGHSHSPDINEKGDIVWSGRQIFCRAGHKPWFRTGPFSSGVRLSEPSPEGAAPGFPFPCCR